VNGEEAVRVTLALNRAGLLRVVADMDIVWGDALRHTSFEDASHAVRALVAERTAANSWVVPGDVLAGVRRLRAARVRAALGTAAPVPPPEVPADDVGAYQAWRHTFLTALGDGRSLHDAETVACEAAGIPPVHRELTAHEIPTFPRLERA
jgi:hypothetical protein